MRSGFRFLFFFISVFVFSEFDFFFEKKEKTMENSGPSSSLFENLGRRGWGIKVSN